MRPRQLDSGDDPLAGAAGLHRRRHDPDCVRFRVHHLSPRQAAVHRPDHRPCRDACAHDRADGRRLPHRLVLLALAVPGQSRARNHRHHRGLAPDRLRRARLFPSDPLRLCRAAYDGRLPRGDGIRARGRAVEGLVREPAGDDRRCDLGGERRRLLLANGDRPPADRRSDRIQGSQFLDRLDVRFRARHRALWPHLHLPGLSGGGARLLVADDRQDHVRDRPVHVSHRSARRAADESRRSANHDRGRIRLLRRRHLPGLLSSLSTGTSGSCSGRRSSAASG